MCVCDGFGRTARNRGSPSVPNEAVVDFRDLAVVRALRRGSSATEPGRPAALLKQAPLVRPAAEPQRWRSPGASVLSRYEVDADLKGGCRPAWARGSLGKACSWSASARSVSAHSSMK
jgi:hypothetical protein